MMLLRIINDTDDDNEVKNHTNKIMEKMCKKKGKFNENYMVTGLY